MWITFGCVHEVRAFRERKIRGVWFRELVENCVVYGDRGILAYLQPKATVKAFLKKVWVVE